MDDHRRRGGASKAQRAAAVVDFWAEGCQVLPVASDVEAQWNAACGEKGPKDGQEGQRRFSLFFLF